MARQIGEISRLHTDCMAVVVEDEQTRRIHVGAERLIDGRYVIRHVLTRWSVCSRSPRHRQRQRQPTYSPKTPGRECNFYDRLATMDLEGSYMWMGLVGWMDGYRTVGCCLLQSVSDELLSLQDHSVISIHSEFSRRPLARYAEGLTTCFPASNVQDSPA